MRQGAGGQQNSGGQPPQNGGQRLICQNCSANNFVGQAHCWQCRTALPGAVNGMASAAAPISPAIPHTSILQPTAQPYPLQPAYPVQGVGRTNFPLLFGGVAVVTFVLVLMFAMHARPETVSSPTVLMPGRSTGSAGPIDSTLDSSNASNAAHSDPVDDQARRVIETESPKIGIPPSASVSPDGRIHLRSGGTISKEEWDNARRKAQESPVIRDSSPPIPPL